MNHLWTWLLRNGDVILSVASAIFAGVGVIIGFSIKAIAALTTDRLKKQIVSESEQNFLTVLITHPDDDHLTSVSELFDKRHPIKDGVARPPSSADLAKKQVRLRLEEIIEERERQESVAKWSSIASSSLTFGQYIIGALLATSFAQDSLSKTSLGALGLLVLFCSAMKQYFHVDENAKTSDYRAKRLRALVRNAQDQIAIYEAKSVNGEDRTDAYISLLNDMSASLNQIESPDFAFTLPKSPVDKTVKS